VRIDRFRAHHATAKNIVNPPDFHPKTLYGPTIDVSYSARRFKTIIKIYLIVFIEK
jgi:hypothetical protein